MIYAMRNEWMEASVRPGWLKELHDVQAKKDISTLEPSSKGIGMWHLYLCWDVNSSSVL